MNADQAREAAQVASLELIAKRKEANRYYMTLQDEIAKAAARGETIFEMSNVLPVDFAEDNRQQLNEALKFLTNEGFSVSTKNDKLSINWGRTPLTPEMLRGARK